MSELDAAKLRRLRKRRGFSQDEMARRAGVDERTIRRAELGQTQPHPETMRIFATTLGVDVADLMVEPNAEATEAPAGLEPHPVPTGPVLAVLPFVERAAKEDAASVGYFSSGLLDDLVTRLSMMRLFPVISRNSTLQLANSAMAPREICRVLGARYVVEGSIQRHGPRTRTRVSLVNGETAQQIWVETYDADALDLWDVQEDISLRVASALAPAVLRIEKLRVSRRAPSELNAWDYALLGLWHLDRRTSLDSVQAREHFDRARKLDPGFVLPWYGDAISHYTDIFNGWSSAPERSVAALRSSSFQARNLDPDDPSGLLACAYSALVAGDREAAVGQLERSLELNPSAVRARSLLANLLAFAGNSDAALQLLDAASRLSPRDPMAWTFDAGRAHVHFVAGRYQNALDCARSAEQLGPPDVMVQAMIAALSLLLGHQAEAQAVAERLRKRWPRFGRATIRRILILTPPDRQRYFTDPLRQLGL